MLFLVVMVVLGLCNTAMASPHINAFVFPHSHDDTGWQRTVDEYHWEEVRHTYDAVVRELQGHPDRRFIFVEMAFMQRWWELQTNDTKTVVRSMVASGQIEIVNGGHCMADGANPDLRGFIDQMTVGHQWVLKELGVVPKIGYHIDPFGEGASIPALSEAFGYDMFVGNRISFDLKEEYKTQKHLEFMWAPSSAVPNSGGSAEDSTAPSILTHILDSHYSAVSGFDWEYFDNLGGDDLQDSASNPAIVDTPASAFDIPNIKERCDSYVAQLQARSEWYSHDNLLVPFGDDFKWQNARIQFENMDKVIAYINQHPADYNVTIKYATVSEYVAALKADSSITFPTYAGDFFPYEQNIGNYWSGYFTSRPQLKGIIRQAEGTIHSAEVACAVAFDDKNCQQSDLLIPRRAVAVSHHHDAITGTSLPPVVGDFEVRSGMSSKYSVDRVSAVLAGIPSSALTEDDAQSSTSSILSPVTVTVWNSLAWSRTEAVIIQPVSFSKAVVTNGAGETVPSQLDELVGEALADGTPQYRVVFSADVPPVGFSTFTIAPSSFASIDATSSRQPTTAPSLSNAYVELEFNTTTGKTSRFLDLQSKRTMSFDLDFAYYDSAQGSNPYVFVPFGGTPNIVSRNATIVSAFSGPVMSEVNQTFSDYISVTYRVFHGIDAPFVEAVMHVTPDHQDMEIVARITTDLNNKDATLNTPVFYTDTLGLLLQKRAANFMPWTLQDPSMASNISDFTSANFYPSPTTVSMYDPSDDVQLTVLGDRARAVSSLNEGELQLLVHRRCAETQHIPLDDTTLIHTSNLFATGNATASTELQRKLTVRHANPVVAIISGADGSDSSSPVLFRALRGLSRRQASSSAQSFSALSAPLPLNVHMLTLEALDVTATSTVALFRLHHLFAEGEHPVWSKPAVVDLSKFFDPSVLSVTALQEMNLSGVSSVSASPPVSMSSPSVTLQPLTIRTFKVTLTKA